MPILVLLLAAASAHTGPAPTSPENLLQGPARCVLRYLDAVRLSGPRVPGRSPRLPAVRANDYQQARLLTAPRALEEADRAVDRGEDHPLAPWREAARGTVLESFQLLAVRRAPRAAAVVTVRERFWRAGVQPSALERSVSEYLVARVGGEWRVVARRPGGAFDDEAVAGSYAGWFDDSAGGGERRSRSAPRRPGADPTFTAPGPPRGSRHGAPEPAPRPPRT